MEQIDGVKKNASVAWRDKDGNIKCQKDNCTHECKITCPIWFHTKGIELAQKGDYYNAINEFTKAINIAPDFKGAWVNLATTHGIVNNHMEALKAYRFAYIIDNNYKSAIYGLIISCKNLGLFEEALEYCDEYEKKIDKAEADQLRSQVLEVQKSGKVKRQESAFAMAFKIVDHARSTGLLGPNEHFSDIPEVMFEGKKVCKKIFQDIIKDKDGQNPIIWLAWGAYAGMGAVHHWQVDWNKTVSKGIAETLLEPRGSYAMDEYVLDSIGIPFKSKEGKNLHHQIHLLAMWSFSEFMMDLPKDVALPITLETMQAMYIFGMVFEMEHIGMR